MPMQLSAEIEASQRAPANLLHPLLERLRLLTGAELEWCAESAPQGESGAGAEVRVLGRGTGWLRAPASPPAVAEQAATLLSDWLTREAESARQAAEMERHRETSALVRRVLAALSPVSDRQRVCEMLLDEMIKIFTARSATLRLRDPQGGEVLSVAARASDCALEARGGDEILEVPVLRPRGPAAPEEMGTLRLSGRRDGSRFTAADGELARELGETAGMLLHHGRLIEETRQSERRRRDLEMARELHSALLPAEDPHLSGIEAAGACLPAQEIGGENFSYLLEETGGLCLILLEASGYGAGAVMAAAAVRALLRAEAARTESPAAALRSANRLLARDLQPSGQFATAFLARCVDGGRRLITSGAGHPAALLWSASEGRFERLHAGGLALGIFEDAVYEQEEKELVPGDLIVAFTDGLVEARDASQEAFSVERICQVVMRHRRERPRTLLYRLLEAAEAFRGSQPQADDITVAVLRAVQGGG